MDFFLSKERECFLTSGQKVAVSLLLTIFLFTGFVVLAFSGFFSLIETRFYQPSLIKAIEENLKSISQGFSDYTDEQLTVFESYTQNKSIKSVSNPAQTSEDIAERSKLFSETTAKFPGFLGLKIVDTNGKYIHYSSFDSDVLKQQSNAISYKNYDTTSEYPYEELAVSNLILDSSKNQLIFSFPYINDYDTEQGRVLFYVSAKDFNRYLISQNLINVNQTTNLINNSSKNNSKIGFILGFPVVNQDFFTTAVQEKWNMDLFTPQSILDTDSDKWIVISDNSSPKITVAAVEQESYFLFSDTVKILLLACLFISIYLIFFLLFNLKQDSMVVIKHKIKKFQLAFINQYLEKENSSNWETLKTEINKRKNDLSLEVKKSLGTKAKRHSKEIDSFLSKSWEDILSVLTTNKNVQVSAASNINMDEIKSMLEQILASGTITVKASPEPQKTGTKNTTLAKPVIPATKVQKQEHMETLDEVEELDEVETLDEVEELDEEVETLDEVEELDEVETLDEVEELSEEVTELSDTVEFLDELKELNAEETQKDYLAEPLIFSDGGKKTTSVLSSQQDTFEVFKPDFSFLDENPQEPIKEQESLEDKSEELKQVSKTTHYFSFTNYGAASIVKDLKSVDYDPTPTSSIEEDNGNVVTFEHKDAASVRLAVIF